MNNNSDIFDDLLADDAEEATLVIALAVHAAGGRIVLSRDDIDGSDLVERLSFKWELVDDSEIILTTWEKS